MPQIQRFEELIAWQKARSLAALVYEVTRQEKFARDFGLSSQIQRSAVSAMSNIAEGFERSTKPDFLRFLTMAKASCAEVRSQLYVALDVGYLSQSDFGKLLACAEEVARVIGGLRLSIERQMQKSRSTN
jgi:four helix bundle protein